MPQISKSKSWGQLFWGGSCTDRRTSTGQHTGPVGSCELMLASTDLQLQLLAGQEQKALLPFPSSFQWELVWPWPNSPGWGQPRVGQMYFITQTFSLFIFDYCTPATQTTEESEKNTEGKKKKSQVSWGADYIFVHFHLTLLEEIKLILNELWLKSYNILYESKTEAAATFDKQPFYQTKTPLILSVLYKSHLYIIKYPNTLSGDDAL